MWKRIGKALLFPPLAVMIVFVPLAAVLLVVSMALVESDTPFAYVSYAFAAYTLTVWCVKAPRLFARFKAFKETNKLARRWRDDVRLRVTVSLYGSLAWNALYGIFQLWLGLYHRTFWFASLGAFSLCLGVMRFSLLSYTKRYAPGEQMRREWVRFRACGWILLLMNLALALVVFFMVYWGRTFRHHMITAIAMAAYTFTVLPSAVAGAWQYGKYKSPVLLAAKAVSLAAAIVSVLTLEATMLTAFGEETMTAAAQRWLLGATGVAVCALIIAMAVFMIVLGTKRLKQQRNEVQYGK